MVSTSDAEFQRRLLQTFKREAIDHVNSMFEGLLEIEKKGLEADHTLIIDELFRHAHSLKGSARTVNVVSIEELCQEIESLLQDIKKGRLSLRIDILETLQRACSVLEHLISEPDSPIPYHELVSKIRSLRENNLVHDRPRKDQLISDNAEGDLKVATEDSQPQDITDRPSPNFKGQSSKNQILKVDTKTLEGLFNQLEDLLSVRSALEENLLFTSKVESCLLRVARVLKDLKDMSAKSAEISEDINTLLTQLKTHQNKSLKNKHSFEQRTESLLFCLKRLLMMPFSLLFEPFPRMISEIAKSQGKRVDVVLEGSEVEADRRILEELREPLLHILRNSIDHGIETPEERIAASKDPKATIKIVASLQKGNEILLRIIDDGRGIDIAKLKDRLLKKGLIEADALERMTNNELIQYIFKAEVSTADRVTNLSGRGIGLSIAQQKVQSLGGYITVKSEPLQGTAFFIRLPVNLSTVKIIVVRAFDGRLYGLPTKGVLTSMRLRSDSVKTVDGKETITYKGMCVSVISIDELLNNTFPNETDNQWRNLMLLSEEERVLALWVKEILYEEEVFLKDLGKQLKKVTNISGSALLSSGKLILVLNTFELLRSAIKRGSISTFHGDELTPIRKKKHILLAEDSITARTLFKGILEGAGYNVTAVVDGAEAWNELKTKDYDLLVSDVQMPMMNGFELTSKIRNDKRLFKLPVVLVTGLESRQDKEKGIQVGANAYIVKSSFDQSNLLEVIKRLI